MDAAEYMLRDVLYEIAERVRETYALRADPHERGRWMAYSQVYSALLNKIEAFDLAPTASSLEGEMFKDLPTFP